MRSLHDLDALTGVRGKARGIAYNHADRLGVSAQVVQNLMADQASVSSNDNHEKHLQVKCREVAWILSFWSMWNFLENPFFRRRHACVSYLIRREHAMARQLSEIHALGHPLVSGIVGMNIVPRIEAGIEPGFILGMA